MNFCTLRQEALTALLTATGEAGAAIAGAHAGAKAMLILAGALGGLVGAFGHNGKVIGKVG